MIQIYEEFCKAARNIPDVANDCFAPCTNTQEAVPCNPGCIPCKPQKKETTMYVDNDKHIESSKINYLSQRVSGIWYIKHAELMRQFGLVDDEAPSSAQEIVDRITSGKYVLKADTKDKKNYDPIRYIRWRDPAVKEDQDGLDAAMKLLDKARQDTIDTVAIDTPINALAAVKALEA